MDQNINISSLLNSSEECDDGDTELSVNSILKRFNENSPIQIKRKPSIPAIDTLDKEKFIRSRTACPQCKKLNCSRCQRFLRTEFPLWKNSQQEKLINFPTYYLDKQTEFHCYCPLFIYAEYFMKNKKFPFELIQVIGVLEYTDDKGYILHDRNDKNLQIPLSFENCISIPKNNAIIKVYGCVETISLSSDLKSFRVRTWQQLEEQFVNNYEQTMLNMYKNVLGEWINEIKSKPLNNNNNNNASSSQATAIVTINKNIEVENTSSNKENIIPYPKKLNSSNIIDKSNNTIISDYTRYKNKHKISHNKKNATYSKRQHIDESNIVTVSNNNKENVTCPKRKYIDEPNIIIISDSSSD